MSLLIHDDVENMLIYLLSLTVTSVTKPRAFVACISLLPIRWTMMKVFIAILLVTLVAAQQRD
jgi:hypothetical protein